MRHGPEGDAQSSGISTSSRTPNSASPDLPKAPQPGLLGAVICHRAPMKGHTLGFDRTSFSYNAGLHRSSSAQPGAHAGSSVGLLAAGPGTMTEGFLNLQQVTD